MEWRSLSLYFQFRSLVLWWPGVLVLELLRDSICTITRDSCERRQISGHIVLVAFKSHMQIHYYTAVHNQWHDVKQKPGCNRDKERLKWRPATATLSVGWICWRWMTGDTPVQNQKLKAPRTSAVEEANRSQCRESRNAIYTQWI